MIEAIALAGFLALGVCSNIDGVQDTIPPGHEAGPANSIGPTCVPADLANPGEVETPEPEITPSPTPETEVSEPMTMLPVTGGEVAWWLIIPAGLGLIAGATLVVVNREEK